MITSVATRDPSPTVLTRGATFRDSVDWRPDRPHLTVIRRWPGGSYVTGGAFKPDDVSVLTWLDSVDAKRWEIRMRSTADPGVDPGHRQGTIAPGFYRRVWRRGTMHAGTRFAQDCLVPTVYGRIGYWPTNDRRLVTPATPILLGDAATGICMHRGYGAQVLNNSDACVAVFDVPEFDAAMRAIDALFLRTGAVDLDVVLLELADGDPLLRMAA